MKRYQRDCPGPAPSMVTSQVEKMKSSLQPYICKFPGCNYSSIKLLCLEKHEKLHKNCSAKAVKNKLQCNHCDYLAQYPYRLKLHMKVHSEEKPFSCDVPGCDFKTRRKDTLTNHKKRVHEDENTVWYECDKCDYRTKQKYSLEKQHARLHAEVRVPKTFKCELCDFDAYTRCQLEIHMGKHTGEKKLIPCDVPDCSFIGTSYTSVNMHKKQVHWEKTWYKCKECSYQTWYKAYLTAHMKIHSDEKPFKCTFEGCEYRAKTQARLGTHLNRHDYDQLDVSSIPDRSQKQVSQLTKKITRSVKRYPCTHSGCNYVGKVPAELSVHQQVHDPNRTKSFKCLLCPKLFYSEASRRVHVRTHTNEKPFKCTHPGCEARAYHPSALKIHEAIHQGVKPFRCDYPGCDYSAACRGYLRRHSQTHDSNRERKFQCSLCTMRFYTGTGLKRHVFTHTKEKPFKCTVCGYAAAHGTLLKRHRCPEKHTKRQDGKPYWNRPKKTD